MERYNQFIEKQMKDFYNSLNEKDKRHYAAIESLKIGWGGETYISNLLGCDRKTIDRGKEELENGLDHGDKRIRREGAGRKSKLKTIPNIDSVFLDVLKENTAGDPMNDNVKWTYLTQEEIVEKLKEKGITVSVTVVKQLLKNHKFVKRKAQKMLSFKEVEYRNEQFERICELSNEYSKTQNPELSIDTKKRNI